MNAIWSNVKAAGRIQVRPIHARCAAFTLHVRQHTQAPGAGVLMLGRLRKGTTWNRTMPVPLKCPRPLLSLIEQRRESEQPWNGCDCFCRGIRST